MLLGSIAATAVDVQAISDIPAGNLQVVLGKIYGKAEYAANGVGEAIYKADQANTRLNSVEGIAADASSTAYNAKGQLDGYVAPKVGQLDSEMTQVFAELGLTRSGATATAAE